MPGPVIWREEKTGQRISQSIISTSVESERRKIYICAKRVRESAKNPCRKLEFDQNFKENSS